MRVNAKECVSKGWAKVGPYLQSCLWGFKGIENPQTNFTGMESWDNVVVDLSVSRLFCNSPDYILK